MELPKLNRPQIQNKKPGMGVIAKRREPVLLLPTERTQPERDISRFKYYFFGARKVGKTSLASEFPDLLNIFTEPSGSDYEIFALNVYDWDDVLDIVGQIEAQGAAGTLKYKNVSFDIVDKAYAYLVDYVCVQRGCTKEDLGWGWDDVKQGFEAVINRLARYVGVIFIAHTKEREITRADGTKYETMMPSSMKNCYELISSICDMTAYFYINAKNKRMLRILPHMESTTGNRFENHFNYRNGGKIDEIDMGITKQDAYKAFKAGFNNEIVRPAEVVQDIQDVEDVEVATALPLRKTFQKKGK